MATDRALDLLTPEERAKVAEILEAARKVWRPLPGPQTLAYESKADIVGYGGAAGGGKTDLIAGLCLTQHKRCLIIRREKAQTEGVVQRLEKLIGSRDGYSSQHSRWNVSSDVLLEFGGLDNPGDESRWQGRAHDLKAFDEATEMREAQVRFIMGWTRTDDESVRPRALLTFNPPTTVEGRWIIPFFGPWLDPKHPNPARVGELRWFTTIADKDREVPDSRQFVLVNGEPFYDFDDRRFRPEDIITPKSRTFIPARVTDNPYYMATGYVTELQALPEPLRSQMLFGDFKAGMEDDPYQVIPTAWVEAAQRRWKRPDVLPPMSAIGVDVAMGGKDNTILARRHGMWFDAPIVYPGSACPDGPTIAGLIMTAMRDRAVIHLDLFGVGAQPYGHLMMAQQHVIGVNVGEPAIELDASGRLGFFNLRSQLWWRMREALDPHANNGIALPPDQRLLADLCAPTWKPQGSKIKVASRDEIVDLIGRSPDWGSAYCLALMDTPKMEMIEEIERQDRKRESPIQRMERQRGQRSR